MMIQKLETSNLILHSPTLEDLSAIHLFEQRNKVHLEKWEPLSLSDREMIHQRLKGWIQEEQERRAARFCIRQKNNLREIIGFCNFTQIYYGAFQSCYLGYKIDHSHQGKGWMFEALETLIPYVFKTLGLHRIMANYMPINHRSARLLHRLNFRIEGYAKRYLLIQGTWEDHVLTSLILEE